ncbi:hypothetical protein Lfu02_42080 [Longispora fulva]|uniref:Uncharacterized protein n=1 Tax=Longispora fulva TaxID=619741 RepID=A0A8J7KWK3_9ACTN|nr:hypothetical protein [Longispora fulva]GIG59836.1 hypothetical protein Lfu02_42080 [Longispora fulva]
MTGAPFGDLVLAWYVLVAAVAAIDLAGTPRTTTSGQDQA